MSQLLGMSFDVVSSPVITLGAFKRGEGDPEAQQPYGWGFGWYPGEDSAATVIKDPTSIGDNAMTQVLRDWKRFRSSVFVCHLRGAAQRITQQDTHPFQRSYAGRDWILAHNGDVRHEQLRLPPDPAFEPVGRTDTEHFFCWILDRIRELGARRLADVGWGTLHAWLQELNLLGTLNLIFTDGDDVVVHHDQGGFNALHWIRRVPPHEKRVLSTPEIELDLSEARDQQRSMVLFSTAPLSDEAWIPMQRGQTLVARRGQIVWDSAQAALRPADEETLPEGEAARAYAAGAPDDGPSGIEVITPSAAGQLRPQTSRLAPHAPASAEGAPAPPRPRPAPSGPRRLALTHVTTYRYEKPVEQSTHLFRLRPVHDLGQQVLENRLELQPSGSRRDFEDVFGNHVTRFKVERPYTELRIATRSLVEIGLPPDFQSPPRRVTIPLLWMPWQRQMMSPYLLPPELPESELRDLSEYAMSFVERQDYDLLETLRDLNQTIYRDFKYVQGSTHLETTPYEVFVHRKGVCQDFANLLICLARLLGVPARYRVGYIHTGADYENKLQSEASHAWAELYLPWTGWRGFDPTNGCMAGGDHIRVATGRNYRDATPTSGSSPSGFGTGTLEVDVRVQPVTPDQPIDWAAMMAPRKRSAPAHSSPATDIAL